MIQIPTPRKRVTTALQHIEPDRVPVDFLATPEVWQKLGDYLKPDVDAVGASEFIDPTWEAVLRHFKVDCRLLSYDQFCSPPESILYPGAKVEWWDVLTPSTIFGGGPSILCITPPEPMKRPRGGPFSTPPRLRI